MRRNALILFLVIALIPSISFSHPGRTDSKGGHTCRTNCEKWGLRNGEYHFHNSGSSSAGSSYSKRSYSSRDSVSKSRLTPQRSYHRKRNYRANADSLVVHVDQSPTSAQSGNKTSGETGEKKYNRKNWRHWTDKDGDCQDTRDEILIRDSFGIITYMTEKECDVKKGRWFAPYIGRVFTNPSKLDIDHIVPLSHAYKTGGANWSKEKKRNFANDLQNLVAVTSHANQSKEGATDIREKMHAKDSLT